MVAKNTNFSRAREIEYQVPDISKCSSKIAIMEKKEINFATSTKFIIFALDFNLIKMSERPLNRLKVVLVDY